MVVESSHFEAMTEHDLIQVIKELSAKEFHPLLFKQIFAFEMLEKSRRNNGISI